jgi:hypothetical protein
MPTITPWMAHTPMDAHERMESPDAMHKTLETHGGSLS